MLDPPLSEVETTISAASINNVIATTGQVIIRIPRFRKIRPSALQANVRHV
jgi:hypothetical protein